MILKFSNGLYINTNFISMFRIYENKILIKLIGDREPYKLSYGESNLNMCDYEHDKELLNTWLKIETEVKE